MRAGDDWDITRRAVAASQARPGWVRAITIASPPMMKELLLLAVLLLAVLMETGTAQDGFASASWELESGEGCANECGQGSDFDSSTTCQCTACEPGQFSNNVTAPCAACTLGKYSASGATACTACTADVSTQSEGAAVCLLWGPATLATIPSPASACAFGALCQEGWECYPQWDYASVTDTAACLQLGNATACEYTAANSAAACIHVAAVATVGTPASCIAMPNVDCVEATAATSTCAAIGQELYNLTTAASGLGLACTGSSTLCTAGDGSIPPVYVPGSGSASWGIVACDGNDWEIRLLDIFGDGWSGNVLSVVACDGTVLKSGVTLDSGYSGTADVCLPAGDGYTITAGGGTYAAEISWTLADATGATVVSGAGGQVTTCGRRRRLEEGGAGADEGAGAGQGFSDTDSPPLASCGNFGNNVDAQTCVTAGECTFVPASDDYVGGSAESCGNIGTCSVVGGGCSGDQGDARVETCGNTGTCALDAATPGQCTGERDPMCSPVSDTDGNCAEWAQAGRCTEKQYASTMWSTCQASCGYCHTAMGRTKLETGRHAMRFVSFGGLGDDNSNSDGKGGAIRLGTSANHATAWLSLSNAMFVGNTATTGGAIFVSGAHLAITNSTFQENYAESNWGDGLGPDDGGGAIAMEGGLCSITYTLFKKNFARWLGGAIRTREIANLNSFLALHIMGCVFDGNHVSADLNDGQWGGGLFALGGTYTIVDTKFVDNVISGEPVSGRPKGGDHICTWAAFYVQIKETVFEPFTDGSGISVNLGGVLSGCEQHPCELGELCSYLNYSLSCSPCPEHTVGMDGQGCHACNAGSEPDAAKISCVPCDEVSFSAFGICLVCAAGTRPNAAQTACEKCPSGTAGTGGTCVPCVAGQQPIEQASACEECIMFGKFSSDGVSCQSCLPGNQPLSNGTACGSCLTVGAAFMSTSGSACLPCPAGQAPNAGRTSCSNCQAGEFSDGGVCQACPPGTEVAAKGDRCDSCRLKDTSDLTFFSSSGVSCQSCTPGKQPLSNRTACESCSVFGAPFVSASGTSCVSCPTGRTPNAGHTGCIECANHEFSDGGVCTACLPGTEVTPERDRCSPCRLKDAGVKKYFSPDGIVCEECWANSEPISEYDRSSCKCLPGFTGGELDWTDTGRQLGRSHVTCIDIDECSATTANSQDGTCNTSTATAQLCEGYDVRSGTEDQKVCGCCHQYSQGCVNHESYFECLPCLDGFMGPGFGGGGCAMPPPPPAPMPMGCDGIPLLTGGKVTDACGACGGTNSSCSDCAGVPNGNAVYDQCGNCAEPLDTCKAGCDGIYGSGLMVDICNICGGDGVCREVVSISIELPGASMCDQSVQDAMVAAVSLAASLVSQYISIKSCTSTTLTSTLRFELRVAVINRRRRMQYSYGDLVASLNSGVAEATGVSEADLTTSVPVSIPIDCTGTAGGTAVLDACDVCSGWSFCPKRLVEPITKLLYAQVITQRVLTALEIRTTLRHG